MGEHSCGCWGNVEIPPIYTAVFDTMVIGLLIAFRPKEIIFHWQTFFQELVGLRFSKRFFAAIEIWLIVAMPITYAMFSVQKTDVVELGTEFVGVDGKKTILLEPKKWIGKEFPLVKYIVSFPESSMRNTHHLVPLILQGSWEVFLYHNECQKCKKRLNEYSFKFYSLKKMDHEIRYLFVEMPPYFKEPEYPFNPSEKIVFVRLSSDNNWEIETPCELTIENDIVREVK
ncbi:MAG: hypothetical protein LBJ67_07085 [Planctomycetaceae bacterium]|jgi:hypothetical protein|nr:hypothetical protein [Planctomycetaceae bacterium]